MMWAWFRDWIWKRMFWDSRDFFEASDFMCYFVDIGGGDDGGDEDMGYIWIWIYGYGYN